MLPNVCPPNLYAFELIKSLEERTCAFVFTVKLKQQKLRHIVFTLFLKCAGKDNVWKLTILIPKTFFWWCENIRFLHKNSVHPFGQTKLCIFKQQFFYQNKLFVWNYKPLQILIHTEKTRATINVWYFMNVYHSFTNSIGQVK